MEIFIPLTAIIAYFIGAIPTGYIIAKLKGINDIRSHGSGNIGATNVSRFLGLHYFFLVLLLDAGKAFLFIFLIKTYFCQPYPYFFAAILLLGNGYSLFLQGSGGKGGATLCGLLAAFNLYFTVLLFGMWTVLVAFTQTVGIASIITAFFLPIFAYTFYDTPFFLFSLFAALWIINTHRPNIRAYWKTWLPNN